MIQLNRLREMRRHLPPSICTPVETIVRETMALPTEAFADDIPLVEVFGSPMFLAEAVDDLRLIRSFDEGARGRLSLLDAPSPWFDIARWEADGGYAVFATIEDADGGPQFYVPAAIAAQVPNVAASIALKGEADAGA